LFPLHYRFAVADSAPPFTEDYVVFVHAIDREGRMLWAADHTPTPATREWTPGATIEYTRDMMIPAGAPTGEIGLELGLYSAKTGVRLPLAGTTTGLKSYRVASFMLPRPQGLPVYASGWNNLESEGGLDWRWTKAQSRMSLRNPHQDSTLILIVDQPIRARTTATRVEVRVGSAQVDSFQLAPGARETRSISVPAAALTGETNTPVTLSVDPTFVPKTVPALHTTDGREVGIRVFTAYFQPR
jgi:hypothetical protein